MKAVQRFYVDSSACARVGNDVGELFPVNEYMDGVVREVNVGVLGKGLVLLSPNDSRLEINQLLFADDTALVGDILKKKVDSECR